MQKILTIVLSIAVILALQPWQIDVACADDDIKKCDPSGLWITEPDPDNDFGHGYPHSCVGLQGGDKQGQGDNQEASEFNKSGGLNHFISTA